MSKFHERMKKHDEFENDVMDKMRPFTTRKHLPDRFISFHNQLYAWDAKTTVFVEDSSHDEYFRVQNEDNIPVFIVYKDNESVLANWIDDLIWNGPFQPSKKSTSGDPYYRIERGKPLMKFLNDMLLNAP